MLQIFFLISNAACQGRGIAHPIILIKLDPGYLKPNPMFPICAVPKRKEEARSTHGPGGQLPVTVKS